MEHKHHGKSSAKYLDSKEILSELNLKGDETFLDAGCGDGYISKNAIENYLPDGKVYAVDLYDESINDLKSFITENDIDNLTAIEADITESIPGVDDDSVDVVFMLNVFHGFDESDREGVFKEFERIIKSDGRIAIMEFKPIEMDWGPPMDIRLSHAELEKLFNDHAFKKTYLNVDIGKDIGKAKSHYLIIFEKE